jgi:hypothetical protein
MYVLMPVTRVQDKYMKIANKYFEITVKFKYLEMTVTNQQNYIHANVKSGFDLGNACYSSVQIFYLPVS